MLEANCSFGSNKCALLRQSPTSTRLRCTRDTKPKRLVYSPSKDEVAKARWSCATRTLEPIALLCNGTYSQTHELSFVSTPLSSAIAS